MRNPAYTYLSYTEKSYYQFVEHKLYGRIAPKLCEPPYIFTIYTGISYLTVDFSDTNKFTIDCFPHDLISPSSTIDD